MARVQEWGACACSPWVKFQATVLKSDARPEGAIGQSGGN